VRWSADGEIVVMSAAGAAMVYKMDEPQDKEQQEIE
jgi:hypothetical protein